MPWIAEAHVPHARKDNAVISRTITAQGFSFVDAMHKSTEAVLYAITALSDEEHAITIEHGITIKLTRVPFSST